MRWLGIIFLGSWFFWMAACGGGSTDNAPPEIRFGMDPCDACRMIISEANHAAALRTATGEELRFDDIGCMLQKMKTLSAAPQGIWVHDVVSGRWLAADSAVYLQSQQLKTPMAYGIAAFAAEKAAQEWQSRYGGRMMRFDELQQLEMRNR